MDFEMLCRQIRRDILRMVHAVNSGHPGGSLGCVEFFVALYGEQMQYNKAFDMQGENQDVFYLSNGHISPVLYSTLARFGFFEVNELASFRKLNTRLQGHPTTHDHLPGVRVATGSLGQGLSVALGHALSKKLNQDTHLVYTLQGDGELQEGQIWEALLYAAANKVDNLIMTIDYNGRQIDGDTDEVLSLGDLHAKLKAFGWEVVSEKEGNNYSAVKKALETCKSKTGEGKPVALVLETEMGAGVDFMMGSHAWHGKAPNNEQLASALAQLPETNFADYVL